MKYIYMITLAITFSCGNSVASSCPNLTGRFSCPASKEDGKPFPPYTIEFKKMNAKGAESYKMDIAFTMNKKPMKTSHNIIADGKRHAEKSEMGQAVSYEASCVSSKLELEFKFDSGKRTKKRTYFVDKEGFFYLVSTIGKNVAVEKCSPIK